MFLWFLCTWMIVLGFRAVQSYTVADETALRGNLAAGYESDSRPSSTVDVEIALQMTSINSLDLKTQSFSISGWWALTWVDSRLTWTPSSYGGIGLIPYFEDDIWTPSLVVSNSLTDLSAIDEDTIPMRVTQDGTVEWNPPGILVTQCDVDTTFFPFDQQECSIEISFDVTLKRRSDFYWLNMLLPVILNGILTIFLFVLPAESGEKVGFSLTVLLTFVVLMTLLAGDMPTSAKYTPLIEVYISLILCLSCLSVILAIINLAIYHMEESKPVPRWASKLCRTYENSSVFCRSRKVAVRETDTTMSSQDLTNYNKMSNREPDQLKKQINPIGQAAEEATNEMRELHDEVTWKELAAVLDAVFLRLYAISIPLITIVFLLVLCLGES